MLFNEYIQSLFEFVTDILILKKFNHALQNIYQKLTKIIISALPFSSAVVLFLNIYIV